MRNAKNRVSTAVLIATLAMLSFTATYSVAQDKTVPTRKEVVRLLKAAKEPPEHRRVAAFYQHEAVSLRQSAKEHSDLATVYERTHPFAAMESKHGDVFGQGASHCKKFAALELEEAKEADALAALHEAMAKEAEKK
jgi:hypothetical protein